MDNRKEKQEATLKNDSIIEANRIRLMELMGGEKNCNLLLLVLIQVHTHYTKQQHEIPTFDGIESTEAKKNPSSIRIFNPRLHR